MTGPAGGFVLEDVAGLATLASSALPVFSTWRVRLMDSSYKVGPARLPSQEQLWLSGFP